MYFLISRFHQQLSLEGKIRTTPLLVCDYLFARDKIFAYLNLDDQEILIYDKYFASLSPYVPTPSLVVYLKAPRNVLMERVRRRKVDYEAKISEQYLDSLVEAYDHFFHHYKDAPMLIVDTAEIDFVENPDDLKSLLQWISTGNIRGVQYYHPVKGKRR